MARGVNQTMAWVVAVLAASVIFGIIIGLAAHIAKKSEDKFRTGPEVFDDPTEKLEKPAQEEGKTIKADGGDDDMSDVSSVKRGVVASKGKDLKKKMLVGPMADLAVLKIGVS